MTKRRSRNEDRRGVVADGAKKPPRSDSQPAAVSPLVDEPAWLTYGLRIWLVAMFGWTLWVTQKLWTDHVVPPLLPVVEGLPFERFDYFGEALFAAFAAAVVWPRVGWWAYVSIAALAMLADQTRMQPQMFSFALLMLGTWKSPAAKLIARSHLASLWFFSGVHKLLSPGYYESVAPWLWGGIAPLAERPWLADYAGLFGGVAAAIEMGMGIAVWFPAMRKYVAVLALLMHFGIVSLLYRLDGWNTSVWGWNCAIAIVGFALVGRWREPLQVDWRLYGRRAGIAAGLLFVSPVLFYFGVLDAYLSQCLYSANVPTAVFIAGDGRTAYTMNGVEGPYWSNLNVPMPPAHRLFELYFRRTAQPGDRMTVSDTRRSAKRTLNGSYQWRCAPQGVSREDLPPFVAK